MKKLYAACNRKWMPRAALLVLAGLFAWTAGVQAQTLQVSGLVTGAQGGGEVGVTIVVKENPAPGTIEKSQMFYKQSFGIFVLLVMSAVCPHSL